MQLLIIDDHPLFLEALCSICRKIDRFSNILAATSVEQALQLLEKNPSIDLILLDLSMPGLDGLSFLEQLAGRSILIPVVVVSSSDDISKIKQALDKGVMGFIPKSSTTEQIQQAIVSVLNGRLSLPPDIEKCLLDTNQQQLHCLAQLNLRKKQLQVLQLMAQGLNNNEIAEALFVTTHTVKSHVAKVFRALKCESRVEAVLAAKRLGLL